jgi:hypothetical protein
MIRVIYILIVVATLASCSKKSAPTEGSAATPAAGAHATPAVPAATSGCDNCTKDDACCAALSALPDSHTTADECNHRAETCLGFGDDMRPDADKSCARRVAKWHDKNPTVAACN